MSVEDFMANYFEDFPRNVKLAAGLDPSVVERTDQKYREFANTLAHIVSSCNDDLLKIHWVSDAADEERHEMVQMKNVANRQHEDIHEYANKNLTPLAQDLGTAQARIMPLAMLSMTGMDDGEPEREAAQIIQQAYGPVGSTRAGELDYQSRASSGDSVNDRGPSPSGPSSMNPVSGGSGGDGSHPATSSPQSAGDAALLGTDHPSSDQSQSAQDDSGGKGGGKGDSLGQGAPGSGSGGGAPGGGPDGGGPGGGPPPGGLDRSGFGTPAADDLSADGLPNGLDSSGLGGGFVGAGGFGGLGSGDRERSLTQKPSAGSAGRPTINFNAAKPAANSPGVIGGGGMAPGAAGKKDEKEHKTADYLKGKEHGLAMLGGELPVASPEVMGELNKGEIKKMEEHARNNKEDSAAKQQSDSPPALPNPADGPRPRRKAD